MAELYRSNIADVDIDKPLRREYAGVLLASGDALANRFGANIKRNGAPVDLTGCKVYGFFIRPNMDTLPIDGAVDGSTAHVDLPASCYTAEGAYSLAIKVSGDDVTATVRVVDGHIKLTQTDTIADPDEKIHSLPELLAMIDEIEQTTTEAKAALDEINDIISEIDETVEDANKAVTDAEKAVTDAQNAVSAVEGMTVSAESGTEANASISTIDGRKHIAFTLPKGDKGDKGDPGYTPVKGVDYTDGEDGVSVTHKWSGTTLSVTSASGTSGADLKGEKGETGVGITDITWTASAEDGGVNVLEISRSDNSADMFFVRNGTKGSTGDPGVSVTHEWDDTTLRVTSASGTSSADLKGDTGEKGEPGLVWRGEWSNNESYTNGDVVGYNGAVYVGAPGVNAAIPDGISPDDDPDSWALMVAAGEDGSDGVGIASIKQTTTSSADGGSNVFTVTLTNGTNATFTVRNGSKGGTGDKGETGETGDAGVGIKSVTQTTTSTSDSGKNIITVTKTDNTTSTFTVQNGSKGSKGDAGYTPVKGTYYYTAAEKTAMIADVTAGLAKITLVGIDENDVQHTWTIHGVAN